MISMTIRHRQDAARKGLLTDDSPINTVTCLITALHEDDQADAEARLRPELRHRLARYAKEIILRDALDYYLFGMERGGFFVRNIMVE